MEEGWKRIFWKHSLFCSHTKSQCISLGCNTTTRKWWFRQIPFLLEQGCPTLKIRVWHCQSPTNTWGHIRSSLRRHTGRWDKPLPVSHRLCSLQLLFPSRLLFIFEPPGLVKRSHLLTPAHSLCFCVLEWAALVIENGFPVCQDCWAMRLWYSLS